MKKGTEAAAQSSTICPKIDIDRERQTTVQPQERESHNHNSTSRSVTSEGVMKNTTFRSPKSPVEERSIGKATHKEEKSKLWWKKREIMENKKKAHMENLRKGVYIQESIHEVAYWKRRESIEKKPFEYVYSARKVQTEKEERKTLEPVKLDSEQNNQVVWKGLTLTSKGAKHDQRNRRKRIKT